MKKNLKSLAFYFLLAVGMATVVFNSCKKDDNGSKEPGINGNNPFAGTWVQDGSDGDVTVVITETTWVAKYENSTYNSGTYTYAGNNAQWIITNKGMSSAKVGDTGNASVSNNKLTVSNFNDEDMNGKYTKK